jgi:hypothetical protein
MLWGNIDYTTGNNKPLSANTTNTSSNSVINGTSANTNKFYGIVAGVSVGETERSNTTAQHPTHAGWVSLKIGTGPVVGVSIDDGGVVNANGFIIVTDTATDSTANGYGVGSGANISYTINAVSNTITSVTVVSGGAGYSNASKLTYVVSASDNVTQPTLTFTLGGRAGRIQTETLVAMGSITLDAPSDNAYYTGI